MTWARSEGFERPTLQNPDYPSGYNAFNSTVIYGLEDLFGTRHLQLTLISTAAPGVQRHYDCADALLQDVVDARVWLGIHFRTADSAAKEMGRQLTAWTLDRYFQPSTRRDSHLRTARVTLRQPELEPAAIQRQRRGDHGPVD